MKNGIVIVNKEKNWTSFDVVAALRGILQTKKIGHAGTLDPDAEGVLVVCCGNATKLVDLLTEDTKCYRAVLLLGMISDTQDATGKIIAKREVNASPQEITDVILSFVGPGLQTPPMYSALKVNGKKLYDLARKGIEVERKARPIEIYEIKILQISLPEVTLEITCSKGTYIRTLCHDIGEKIGCGGLMNSLKRIRSGRFSIENALTMEEIRAVAEAEAFKKSTDESYSFMRPVDSCFEEYPAIIVLPEYDKTIRNGNKFYYRGLARTPEQTVRIYYSTGVFAGLYQYKKTEGLYICKKMFHSNENR